jgi:hypothetical protein
MFLRKKKEEKRRKGDREGGRKEGRKGGREGGREGRKRKGNEGKEGVLVVIRNEVSFLLGSTMLVWYHYLPFMITSIVK